MKYLQTYIYETFSEQKMSLDFFQELSKYDKKIIYDIVVDKYDNISQMVYLFLMASNFKIRLIIHNNDENITAFMRQLEEFRKYYIKDTSSYVPIFVNNNFFILQKDSLFFFFNISNKAIKFILPEQLKNKNTFCIFCNADKYLKDSYIIRPLRFDVLDLDY